MFLFMYALMASSLFWVFLALFVIGLFATVQTERPGWCSTIFVIGLVLIEVFSPYHPITYLITHPLYSGIVLLVYVAGGALWCIVKWASYTDLLKTAYLDYKAKWQTENPNYRPESFVASAKLKFGFNIPTKDSKPEEYREFVGKHKAAIYMWITFWPISALGTLIDDPLRRLRRFIYARISGLLVTITHKTFSKL